ncbi:hypothetical protein DEO72_LG11g1464 [Vigna unguiculata]|uniref:Uncharacterized protein n=1 Tax=Vigna unguiculata TaxID=3917 RepID=A0A4D6NP68_VIGUN|nr:hypothetical protein DEO72_LG11g1464 [Vigna unguiculata]
MLEFSNDWTKGVLRTSLGSNTASFPNELNLESHANAYSVRRSVIEYSHMAHLVLLGVVEEEQLANSKLQKVERLLGNEKAKKGGDREVRKDGKPLVRD